MMRNNLGRFVVGHTVTEQMRHNMRENNWSVRGFPHPMLGKHQSAESVEKMRISKTGEVRTEKFKNNLSNMYKGVSYEQRFGFDKSTRIRKKLSKQMKLRVENGEFLLTCYQKGHPQYNSGRTHFKKGQIPWNKGKHIWLIDRATLKRCLQRRCPSGLEQRAMIMSQQYAPLYKFVGNGKFLVGRKCPDFVNADKMVAVEVFSNMHKEIFSNGLQRWKHSRRVYFARYGWKIYFFNESDTNNPQSWRKLP